MNRTITAIIATASVAAAVAFVLYPKNAVPAAGNDSFAIRGAGLINCALYTQQRSARGDVYLITAAWTDGYITGINQYAPETYDLLSFEGTELLMALLDQHCRANPTDPVFGVLTSLFQKLWPDRITTRSDKLTITVDEKEASHYVHLVERVQRKLQAGGFYAGEISGEYSPELMEAVTRFQQSIGFDGTGFPDQLTLWRLLRSAEEPQPPL